MKKAEFWITNVSKQDVNLPDLRFYVPSGKSFNLLSNHFHFTYEQLVLSAESGSLFHKQAKIKVRLVKPVEPKDFSNAEMKIPLWLEKSKLRSHLIVKEKHYEELDVRGDEEFAKELANMDDDV